MDHYLMIMIVSRYTLARKSSVVKPFWSEWVPIYLQENLRQSSPKEHFPDPIDFIVFWDVVFFLWFSTHTLLTGVFSDNTGYDSSLVMISAPTFTSHIFFPVHHWVAGVFLTPFFCILNAGDTLSARCMQLLLCIS